MKEFNKIENYDLSGFDKVEESVEYKYDDKGNIIYLKNGEYTINRYFTENDLCVETRTVYNKNPHEVVVTKETYKYIGEKKVKLSYRRHIEYYIDHCALTETRDVYVCNYDYNDKGDVTKFHTHGQANSAYEDMDEVEEYDYIIKYDDKNRMIEFMPRYEEDIEDARSVEYDDENNTETTVDYKQRITCLKKFKDGNMVYEKCVDYDDEDVFETVSIHRYDNQNRRIQRLYIENGVEKIFDTYKHINGLIVTNRYIIQDKKHETFIQNDDKFDVSIYSQKSTESSMLDFQTETDEVTGIVTKTVYSINTTPEYGGIKLLHGVDDRLIDVSFNDFDVYRITKKSKTGKLLYRCAFDLNHSKIEDFYEYDDRDNLIRAHVPYLELDMYYKFDDLNREIYFRSYETNNDSSIKPGAFVSEERITTYDGNNKTIKTIKHYAKKEEA